MLSLRNFKFNLFLRGKQINQTETFDWVGLSDPLFLQNLLQRNLTWLDIDFSEINNGYKKLSGDLKNVRDVTNGYIYKIKQTDFYNMTNPSITNRNFTQKNIPQFFKVNIFYNFRTLKIMTQLRLLTT